MFQRAPVIRKAHGGDAFQDLVQFLLARGLKAKWTPGVRKMSPQNPSTRQGLINPLNTKRLVGQCPWQPTPLGPPTPLESHMAVDFPCSLPTLTDNSLNESKRAPLERLEFMSQAMAQSNSDIVPRQFIPQPNANAVPVPQPMAQAPFPNVT